jgi:hypothetical protein
MNPKPNYDQHDAVYKKITDAGFKIIQTQVRENSWWDHAEIWCKKRI